jgi:hypothetical protein
MFSATRGVSTGEEKIDRGEERAPSNDGVVFYRSQALGFGNFTDNHNRW